jgi:hypothetical protein
MTPLKDFSMPSSGDHTSVPAIKMIPKRTAKNVEIMTDVLNTVLLSLVGKNRIMDWLRPKFDSETSRSIDEISAIAIPTSSIGYTFAASIQKMKPKPTLARELRIMKKEFL